jgi:3-oxoacyl-[acyl-carrier protein] reductase
MGQALQSLVDSTLKKVLSVVGVSTPVPLERFDQAQRSFVQGNILVGATSNALLTSMVIKTLAASEATVYLQDNDEHRVDFDITNVESNAKIAFYQQEIEQALRFKALIFDASAITCSENLVQMYRFFHATITSLAPCARIVVLAQSLDEVLCNKHEKSRNKHYKLCNKHYVAQRALEGFVRSLGKEIGKKGATIHLLYVAKNNREGLRGPLQFLLSPRSAYLSAQVLRIEKTAQMIADFDWKKPLAGKVALVTGASQGIGKEIVNVLNRDGAVVVGLDIPLAESQLREVMTSVGGYPLVVDIAASEASETIAEFCQECFSGLDIIVHNAGVTRDKTLAKMPEHFWTMAVDINLSAVERVSEHLLDQGIIRKGGRIVCVSSVSGIAGNFGQTNYGASKAGIIGLVESLANSLGNKDITINAVAPGFIETQMTRVMPLFTREVGKRINALGQAGQPIDVAEAVAFLASPGSAMISGNVLRVCGQSMLGA